MIFNAFGLNLKKSTWCIILATLAWAIYWAASEYSYQLKEVADRVNLFNSDCQLTLTECNLIKTNEITSSMTDAIYTILAKVTFFVALIFSFGVSFKYIFKFIKLGFLNEVKWSSATKCKKAFVIYLVAFNFMVLLLIYLILNEAQKASNIAVSPNDSVGVFAYPKKNPTFVTASGSWKSKNDYFVTNNTMQASSIKCYKAESLCYEAEATARGKFMHSYLKIYPIQDWTSNSVSYGEDGECFKDVYVINYQTETISHSRTYKKLPNCSPSKDEYEYMVDGFDLYMDKYKKLDSLVTSFIAFLFNDKPVAN